MIERNTIRDLSEIECIQVSGGVTLHLPTLPPFHGPVMSPLPPQSFPVPDPKPEPLI